MERPTVVYGVQRCRVVVSGIEVEGRWKPVRANFLFEDLPPITTLKAVHPLTTSSSTLASLLMEEGLPPSLPEMYLEIGRFKGSPGRDLPTK